MSSPSDSAPSLLAARYLVGELIGQGGTADVYRAWDSVLDRDVAVKMLTGLTMSSAARARFEDEGQTLARLSHPGLTVLFDAGTDQGRPYLVMELVLGETLADRCRQFWPDADEVTAIGASLAETLAYVHRCGIVHRDVKPSNVLLGDDQRVRLADFGIARLLDRCVRHTETGMTVGTAAYLAPEQVRGESVTGACDIYALGLVLLEALTGRPVFTGPVHEMALARLTRPPVIDDDLPAPLRTLLIRMTAIDPQARPTAEQVAIALRGGALTPTAPVELPSRPSKIPVLKGIALAAAGAAALVLSAPLFGTDHADGRTLPAPSTTATIEVTASPTPARQRSTPSATARRTDTTAHSSRVVRTVVKVVVPKGPGPAAGPGADPAVNARPVDDKKKPPGPANAPGQLKKIGK